MRTNNSLTEPNNLARVYRRIVAIAAIVVMIAFVSIKLRADTGACGSASVTLPFLDVASTNIFFCSIAEAYFSGITNGTSGITYSPGDLVPRDQMAAFASRTLDQSVKRAGKRAALQQFWTIQGADNLGLTDLGFGPLPVQSDGADIWVGHDENKVSRVRGSDGKRLETWTGTLKPRSILCAMGKVFVVGIEPGALYQIDPRQAAGTAPTLTTNLGGLPFGIAFDGQRIWTANASGSVSIVALNPLNVTTVTSGFTKPESILYDGANIWVSDPVDGKLKELDSSGNILQSLAIGPFPRRPVFDGTNIWVPSDTNGVTVVRATGALAGTVLAHLTGNGLNYAGQAAFDGERILVTNPAGDNVSLWKASDLTPIGTFSTGTGSNPVGACSDGVNFWITLIGTGRLARF